MKLAIQKLLSGPVDDATIAAFLQAHSFPLVEGRQNTFIYVGQADAVNLRHWVYGLASSQPFHRVKRSDGSDSADGPVDSDGEPTVSAYRRAGPRRRGRGAQLAGAPDCAHEPEE